MKKKIGIIVIAILMCIVSGCNTKSKGDTDKKSKESESAKQEETEKFRWPTMEWSRSTPEAQNMDGKVLENSEKFIQKYNTNVYSVVVVRHGYLVYEKYYNNMDENSANRVYSVTKSVTSALTGIALREKLIDNIDQKLSDFLPECFEQVDDERKKDITIRHALTMTCGLETIEDDDLYWDSDDLFAYVLSKPIINNPGEVFSYNTGLTHFLSRIIAKTSNMITKEFADKYLFQPIGINAVWSADKQGYNYGGTGLLMTPLDMAKFGFLYLKNGKWDGRQIIPQEWVEESTKTHTSSEKGDYGFLFWARMVKDAEKNKEYFAYAAQGYGGQYIMVIPELDMVTVVTATGETDKNSSMDVIKYFVIPAAK